VTHFASPGCLWTPLVAVDQKANPTCPGFYNGGVHVVHDVNPSIGAWPGALGDVRPPVRLRSKGKALVGVLGDELSPPEAEALCETSVRLLTFSCRKFRI